MKNLYKLNMNKINRRNHDMADVGVGSGLTRVFSLPEIKKSSNFLPNNGINQNHKYDNIHKSPSIRGSKMSVIPTTSRNRANFSRNNSDISLFAK